MRDLIF